VTTEVISWAGETLEVVSELPACLYMNAEVVHKLLDNLKYVAGPVMPMEETTEPPACFDTAPVVNANLSVLYVSIFLDQ